MEEPANQGNNPADGMIGTVLGDRYELLSLIASGGMGEVYQARHQVLDRVVAVKILHQHRSEDATSQSRLVREGRTLSQLDHPNILKVLAFGISPDHRPYLVMDYLKGVSLAERIKESPLSDEEFRTIFLQILDGLAYAHHQGIVHRDLKPSNILLCETSVKIVDFGIAKWQDASQSQKLTATDAPIGTTLYMSPEQCMGKGTDARSDIYAIGCVMFEAINGKPPFVGDTAYSVMQAHLTSEPPHLQHHFANIIARCLHKDPKSRYQSVEQVRSALAGSLSKKIFNGFSFSLPKSYSRMAYLAASGALVMATLCIIGFIQIPKPQGFDPSLENAAEYFHNINAHQEMLNRALDHGGERQNEVKRLRPMLVAEVDEAEKWLKVRPNATGSEQLAELLVRYYFQSKQIEHSLEIANAVLNQPNRDIRFKESEAKLLRSRALALSALGRYEEGFSAYKETLQYLEENSHADWAQTMLPSVALEKAALCLCWENPQEADHSYNEALRYGRAQGIASKNAVRAEMIYATFLRNSGNPSKAAQFAEEAYRNYLSALRSGQVLEGLGPTIMEGVFQSAQFHRNPGLIQQKWADVESAAKENNLKLDIDPNFVLVRQGDAYRKLRQIGDAERCYRRVVNSETKDYRTAAFISLSNLEMERNNFQNTARFLDEGLKAAQNPIDRVSVYFHYGLCYKRFNKLAEMEKLSDKTVVAMKEAAEFYRKSGNVEASKAYGLLVTLWECYLGSLYWKSKMPDKSLEHFRSGIAYSRQYGRLPKAILGDTLQDMARICYSQKLWKESVSTYKELLTYDDRDRTNRWRNSFSLADSYQHLNQYQDALPVLLAAEKLLTDESADQPHKMQTWRFIGLCYLKQSDFDKAADYYQRAETIGRKIGDTEFAERCLVSLKKISKFKRDALSSNSK